MFSDVEVPKDKVGFMQLVGLPVLPKFINKSTLPVADGLGGVKSMQLFPLVITLLTSLLTEQLPLASAARIAGELRFDALNVS